MLFIDLKMKKKNQLNPNISFGVRWEFEAVTPKGCLRVKLHIFVFALLFSGVIFSEPNEKVLRGFVNDQKLILSSQRTDAQMVQVRHMMIAFGLLNRFPMM